jgi:FKBP-type peptidyl-prolyl cis-trans isomerase
VFHHRCVPFGFSPVARPSHDAARMSSSTLARVAFAPAARRRRVDRSSRQRTPIPASSRGVPTLDDDDDGTARAARRDAAPSRRATLAATFVAPLLTTATSRVPPARAEAPPRPTPRDLGSGVKGVDLIPGALDAPTARPGDAVRVLLKGRLFAKQGWIFTDDYVEGPGGTPEPRAFVLGAGQVIEGLDIAVRGMRVGGVRRVVIPPPVSYRDETQEPIPRDFSNRRRLYTTIFNPTRLANGEGDTLSTVIFDVELVRVGAAGTPRRRGPEDAKTNNQEPAAEPTARP